MKAFVPLTDEEILGLRGTERLVPYRPGLPLASQLTATPLTDGKKLSPDAAEVRRRDAHPVPRPCRR